MYTGNNLWILKPNDFNRGRGVHIFNKIEEFRKLLQDDLACENEETLKSDLFVIQKYIERPMLINDRKFDIRLWVLVT